MFESLEARRHLSVTANDIGDTLYVWGDSAVNGISVHQTASSLVVKEYKGAALGYQQIFVAPLAPISKLMVYGYDGHDTISIADNVTRATTIMGGRGNDYIKAGGGTTIAWGHGDWAADISGSHRPNTDDNAVDTLVTGSGLGAAILRGQGGNDVIYLNSTRLKSGTNDKAAGDAGNDTFHLLGNNGINVQGGSGDDTFLFYPGTRALSVKGDGGADTVNYSNFGVAATIKLGAGSYSGPRAAANVDRKHFSEDAIERAVGSPFADDILGTTGDNWIAGGNGDDRITGLGGRDWMQGDAGNDHIYGGSLNDTLAGGDGNDYLSGGNGNDIVLGQAGNDTLSGEWGNDTMYGGNGNDSLLGGEGNDHLYGEAGHDWIYGQAGANLLVGGAGSDVLNAKNGNWSDLVFGGNTDGSQNTGWLDVAILDLIFYQGQYRTDNRFSIESVSY